MKALQPKKPHNISWPDVYFTAEANREHFEDVHISTLKSFLAEEAYEQAIFQVGLSNKTKIHKRVHTILNNNEIRVMEHVEVTKDRIRVVVDCDEITDDTVWTALDMVASALDELQGSIGRIYFGELKSYKASEISWLNVH